jgi:hypothetical protein
LGRGEGHLLFDWRAGSIPASKLASSLLLGSSLEISPGLYNFKEKVIHRRRKYKKMKKFAAIWDNVLAAIF